MVEALAITPAESLRAVYEKCKYLQARSVFLRGEGGRLCKTSHALRESNALLDSEMSLIRAAGFFITFEIDSKTGRIVRKLKSATTPRR